jgi:hypothetical protein
VCRSKSQSYSQTNVLAKKRHRRTKLATEKQIFPPQSFFSRLIGGSTDSKTSFSRNSLPSPQLLCFQGKRSETWFRDTGPEMESFF